jgi:IclR helix-turn-helix domain
MMETVPGDSGLREELRNLRFESGRDAHRALAILDALGRSPCPLGVRELCEVAELSLRKAQPALTVLERHQFITRTPRFGIGLGARAVSDEALLPNHFDGTIGRLVESYLSVLASEVGGLAYLAIDAYDRTLVPVVSTGSGGGMPWLHPALVSGIRAPIALSSAPAWIGVRDCDPKGELAETVESAAVSITRALHRPYTSSRERRRHGPKS